MNTPTRTLCSCGRPAAFRSVVTLAAVCFFCFEPQESVAALGYFRDAPMGRVYTPGNTIPPAALARVEPC